MFKMLTPTLIRALIFFVIMLIVSIVVVSTSYFYMDGIDSDQQSAKRAMLQWRSKINGSVANNQIIDEYESSFMKLVNQGVVGEEDRLNWLETIQHTAKKRGMPSVKYSISSQALLDEKNIKQEYQGIDVFKSVMTLEIIMAHEGDLFALLNELGRADGLFAVDKCDIEKLNRKVVDSENNMKAHCELGWYSFKASKSGAASARPTGRKGR